MDSKNYFEHAFFDNDLLSGWEMTEFERLVFCALIEKIKPEVAVEVGSRVGGSLQVLVKNCPCVISLDIDETVTERLSSRFPLVEFVVGDSRVELPALLGRLASVGRIPDFIFIDGDHTAEGAEADLATALSLRPAKRTWVLMHDTFNPEVRAGIDSVDFEAYSHLHYADVDFAPGILLSDGPLSGEVWGGFGLFILEPHVRTHALSVGRKWQNMWNLLP